LASFRRLGTRTSTALKTADTIKIMKAREADSRRKRLTMNKQTKVQRKMTQEEILKDSKKTEKMNLESLKKYQEMELENRRRAHGRGARVVQGPAIRYHSVAMPLVEEVKEGEVKEEEVKQEVKQEAGEGAGVAREAGRQGRTFLSFTDQATLDQSFPRQPFRVPPSKVQSRLSSYLPLLPLFLLSPFPGVPGD
jgi:vacuolar protein sorting-associated protein 72